mmetsp:Transcript_5779/g.8502  ORF Transcript_5779/g.8502 Transcript_5779/m.8502 type:complete len:600 (-) Transcript_5779:4-1803(-)
MIEDDTSPYYEKFHDDDFSMDDDVDTNKNNKKKEKERARWGNRISFLLGSIGGAIGFGNFIRFPFLVYKYGGISFLIPYAIALFTVGIPIFFFELSLGQLYQKSAIYSFIQLNKRSSGIAFAMVAIGAFIAMIYYAVILAWVCVYFAYTVINIYKWDLPWANDPEKFFNEDVLNLSSSAIDYAHGFIAWKVTIGLGFVWIFCFFAISFGVKTSGIVAWVTVPLPFITAIALFIATSFQSGAYGGVWAYIKQTNFKLLLDPNTWIAAFSQILFSLQIGNGVMTAFGSYNRRKQNSIVDTFLISIANCTFSLFSGFVVFLILGHLANVQNTTIEEVTTKGLKLAFIALPQSCSFFSLIPPVIPAFILFLMLFSLGVDSVFAQVESVTSVLHDAIPIAPVPLLAFIVCFFSFILGVPLTFSNGYYVIEIVDHYLANYALVLLALLECLIVGWFAAPISLKEKVTLHIISTGKSSFSDLSLAYLKFGVFHSIGDYVANVREYMGINPTFLWAALMKYFIPLVMFLLFAQSLVREIIQPYHIDGLALSTGYTLGSIIIGLLMLISVLGIACCGVFFSPKHKDILQSERDKLTDQDNFNKELFDL